MKTRTIVLLATLLASPTSEAWIAYGFKSGMSRFNVMGQLSDRAFLVAFDDRLQTIAGTRDNRTKYSLFYCSTPQRLYLMKFGLGDSLAEFRQALEKYEKRYGNPEGLEQGPDHWESETWKNVEVTLIWHVNESETILLSHGRNGTIAEFQDVSVCE